MFVGDNHRCQQLDTVYIIPEEAFTEMKKEFIERYKDLLDEAMNHYQYIPYAYRKTVEEYYHEELKYLEGLK